MKTCELNTIDRFYFGYEEIVRALKIRAGFVGQGERKR